MLAPQYTLSDRSRLITMMHDKRIFPTVSSGDTRAMILTRLMAIDGRIPSLYTFFEDTKYLEPCAKIMKCLLPPKQRLTSLYRSFRHMYTAIEQRTGQVKVYSAESLCSLLPGSEDVGIDLGYRQLWLFAMRHFPEMVGVNPRKDAGKPKPEIQKSHQDHWFRFAALANGLGFNSQEIRDLRRLKPDERMVQGFLSHARPHELYDFDPSVFNSEVQRICNVLRLVKPRAVSYDLPWFSTDFDTEPIAHRCGRPYERSHLNDKKYMFLKYIYGRVSINASRCCPVFLIAPA